MSTEVYREAALRDLPCPCNQTCTERTGSCKHDGSCGKYTEWRREYDALVERYAQKVEPSRQADSMLAEKHVSKRYRLSNDYHRRMDKRR